MSLILIFILVFSPLLANATDIVIENPNPDETPPVLHSFSISATQVAVGNSVKLTADASDDLSGIDRIGVSYKGPYKDKGRFLYWNDITKKYEGTISFSNYEGWRMGIKQYFYYR